MVCGGAGPVRGRGQVGAVEWEASMWKGVLGSGVRGMKNWLPDSTWALLVGGHIKGVVWLTWSISFIGPRPRPAREVSVWVWV